MIFEAFNLLGAFMPDWVIILILAVCGFFVTLFIIKLIGFILDAIPFL